MKVCFLVDGLSSGGAERVVTTLANQFSMNGDKAYIVLVSSANEKSFYELKKSVSVISIVKGFEKKVRPFKRIKLLKKIIADINPDVAIAFLPHVIIYSWLSLRNTGITLIVSERNNPISYSPFYKIVLKFIFHHVDGCVFQTVDAMKWYGCNTRSRIIFNPVFIEKNVNNSSIIKRKKEIITVGRLVEQKNFFFLIDTFKKFDSIHNGFTLSIYGDGPLNEKIRNYIIDHNLSDKVFLKGNSAKWHSEQIDASMFLLLSKYEGMPNALEEALVLGIPSVASNCPIGGSKALVELLDFGYLSEINNMDNTIECMEKCLLDFRKPKNVDKLLPEHIFLEWNNFLGDFTKKGCS